MAQDCRMTFTQGHDFKVKVKVHMQPQSVGLKKIQDLQQNKYCLNQCRLQNCPWKILTVLMTDWTGTFVKLGLPYIFLLYNTFCSYGDTTYHHCTWVKKHQISCTVRHIQFLHYNQKQEAFWEYCSSTKEKSIVSTFITKKSRVSCNIKDYFHFIQILKLFFKS